MPRAIYVTGSNLHQQLVDDKELLDVLTPIRYPPHSLNKEFSQDNILSESSTTVEVVGLSDCQLVYQHVLGERFDATGFGRDLLMPFLETHPPARLLGEDYFRAVLDAEGRIWEICYESDQTAQIKSSGRYEDAVMDRHGRILTIMSSNIEDKSQKKVTLFATLEDLYAHERDENTGILLYNELFSWSAPVKLHAGGAHFFIQVLPNDQQPSLYALGDNRHFQLGEGDPAPFVPLQELLSLKDTGSSSFTSVALGDLHSCLVSEEGGLYVAGSDSKGQCAGERHAANFTMLEFEDDDLDVLQVACGTYHTVVLTNQGVYATGSNHAGQLGLGHTRDLSSPTKIPFFDDKNVISVLACDWNTVFVCS